MSGTMREVRQSPEPAMRAPTLLHVDRRVASSSAAPAPTAPLVCLHGWGMNLRVFDPLRDALADERDSWAIDLLGHGRSGWNAARADFSAQVDDVLAVLPPRCVLLGWSLGAKLALELTLRAPERIQALVLVAATPCFAQSPDWEHGMDARALQAFRAVLAQDWQRTLNDFIWLQLRGSRHAEAAQQQLQQALATHGAPHPEALQRGMELLGHVDLRARLSQVMQPALLIAGQHDRVTPPGAAHWMSQALPDARLITVARAGHAPFASHHDEVLVALRDFLAELPP
jgi:pimeloyl-[acyl-carrier protein] methyl ester esterase